MANNMYYSILTTVGTEKLAQAIITEIPVKITTIAVGDGNGQFYSPTPEQTQLKRETWRGDINDLRSANDADNHILAEGIVPADVGGWTIREVGLFDDSGVLIAVCNYPDTIKPMPSSGSGKQVYIQVHLVIDNIAALELIIDGNIVTASKKYVDDRFDKLSGPNGASEIGYRQPGDGALQRAVLDKLLESAVSVLEYKLPSEGNYIDNALRRLISSIKTNVSKSRAILIPGHVGEWLCANQVLFDVSDITIFLYGNVRLASVDRQKTFLFSYSNGMDPSVKLKNITLIGNGSTVNGNGSAMDFNYVHGDGSDNDSTVRFNYVDNVKVFNLEVNNGPIDCLSLRRCRNWLVDGCTFTGSKEDNGFSVTTDWSVWSVGRPETWGFGTIRNCIAYDNQDFGMTSFNATGVTFDNCISYNNRGGFSYEDSYSAPGVKRFFGLFTGCSAYNCQEQGYYIQCDGIRVDDTCSSWNIRGYEGQMFEYSSGNSAGIFENGVVVSNVATCYVGGSHEQCGHSGVAIFNGTSRPTAVTVSGTYSWNDSSGIYARGVGELTIVSGTAVRGNGRKLFNGMYSYNINVSNSGGAGYFQGGGFFKADGIIVRDGGLGAIRTNYLGTSIVSNCNLLNNAYAGTSPAVTVERGGTARISENHAPSNTGNQTFVVNIDSLTETGIEYLNTGDATVAVSANNAYGTRQVSRGAFFISTSYEGQTVVAGSQVAINLVVRGVVVGDFVQVSLSSTIGRLMTACEIPSSDNVVVYLRNFTGNPISYSGGQIRVHVTKRAAG